MTKNVVTTYCIHKGKREATDGAWWLKRRTHNSSVEDRKRDIFNKNLRVYVEVSLSHDKKITKRRCLALKILAYKKSVEKPIKIICANE